MIVVENDAAKEFAETTKLWQILELALRDLELIENNPKYVIDMDYWCVPFGSQCTVCLAGSVIANIAPDHLIYGIYPSWFTDRRIYVRLLAIDQLRHGAIAGAYSLIRPDGFIPGITWNNQDLPPYGSVDWLPRMKSLLSWLKERDV